MKSLAFAVFGIGLVTCFSTSVLAGGGSPPVIPPAPVAHHVLFASPAFEAVCAGSVIAQPGKPGAYSYWHPSFALTENALFATMDLRPTAAGEFAVVKIDPAQPASYGEVIRFREPIHSLEYHDQKLWLLFDQRIVAIDPLTAQTILEVRTVASKITAASAATGFAWVGNRLVIAHGALGTVTFDPASKRMSAPTDLGLEASGIRYSSFISVAAVDESKAIFAVENRAPAMFEGLIMIDVNHPFAATRLPFNESVSGSLTNASVKVYGDQVIINNWGIFQRASLKAMMQSHDVQVSWTPIHFSINGIRTWGELLGDSVIDRGILGSCAHTTYEDPQAHKAVHLGVGYADQL